MNEQEFAELAAGHALGALDADDERRFQDALAAHPEWSRPADVDVATVGAIGELVEPIEPPPQLRAAILASAAQTPQGDAGVPTTVVDAATARSADAARPRWSRAWLALAACIALVVAIGGIVAVVAQQAKPAAVVALERIQAAPDAAQASAAVAGGGEATLHWSAELGEAVLVSDGLPVIAESETFELWYVRDDTPIPAGTFDAASGTTSALLEPGLQTGDIVAVTVEPTGGSPTGQPTSDLIVAIPTA